MVVWTSLCSNGAVTCYSGVLGLVCYEESSEGSMESLQQSKESGQLCLFLSEAAVSGADSPKSMRMWGSIQGQDVLLLVDSGSSHSFMSSKIAAPRLKVLYCCTLCQW
jgi:hypothetical protein